jgi:hypothetical protein
MSLGMIVVGILVTVIVTLIVGIIVTIKSNSTVDKYKSLIYLISILFILTMMGLIIYIFVKPDSKSNSPPKDCGAVSMDKMTIFIQSNDDSLYDPTKMSDILRESYILDYKNGSFLNMAIPGGKPCITSDTTVKGGGAPIINTNAVTPFCQESIVVVDKKNKKIFCLIANTYTSRSPLPCVFTNTDKTKNPEDPKLERGDVKTDSPTCEYVTYNKGEVWYIENGDVNSNNIWKKTPFENTYKLLLNPPTTGVLYPTDNSESKLRLDQTIVCYDGCIYKIDFPTATGKDETSYTYPADYSADTSLAGTTVTSLPVNIIRIQILDSKSLLLSSNGKFFESGIFAAPDVDNEIYTEAKKTPLSYSVTSNVSSRYKKGGKAAILLFTVWPTTPDTKTTPPPPTKSWIASFNMAKGSSLWPMGVKTKVGTVETQQPPIGGVTPCIDGVYTAAAPVVAGIPGASYSGEQYSSNFYILRADMLCVANTTLPSCGLDTTRCYGLRIFNSDTTNVDNKNSNYGFIPSTEYEKNIILFEGVDKPHIPQITKCVDGSTGVDCKTVGDTPKHPIYQMYAVNSKIYLPYSPALYEIDVSLTGCTLNAKNILPTVYDQVAVQATTYPAGDAANPPFLTPWNSNEPKNNYPPSYNECGSIATFYDGGKDDKDYIIMINPNNRRMIQRYNTTERDKDGKISKDSSKVGIWTDEKPYIYSGKPTLNVMSCDLEHNIIIIPQPASSTSLWGCPNLPPQAPPATS